MNGETGNSKQDVAFIVSLKLNNQEILSFTHTCISLYTHNIAQKVIAYKQYAYCFDLSCQNKKISIISEV